MRNILAFMLLVTVFGACKKEEVQFELKGRLLKDCNGQPQANYPLQLFQTNDGGNYNSSVLGTTVTDADGYFRFIYTTRRTSSFDYLKLQTPAGFGYSDLMVGIPPAKQINDITVYAAPRINFQLSILATNTYSTGDTLFITDLVTEPQYRKIPAPLTSGVLYTVMNTGSNGMRYPGAEIFRDEQTGTKTINWYVKTPLGNTPVRTTYYVVDKYCLDTTKALIEIK